MEVLLDCFFENFSQLEHDILHARYKRRAMVEYFNTLIEGCCRGESCDPQKTCREAVIAILRYHDRFLTINGSVCKMGKYHNILYVAVRLCYDWQLQDTATITAVLDQIYNCEKTFERLWIGALFGIGATYLLAGWKSDFDNQEENVRALVFFLNNATDAHAEYFYESKQEVVRFIDLPIDICGRASPLKITVQLGIPDKLLTLLRFGAQDEEPVSIFEGLLSNLTSYNRAYPYNLIACLEILLRALPAIYLEIDDSNINNSNKQKDVILERFPELIEDGIVPVSRCGIEPPQLKHLCRCTIRQQLWRNYQLPNGIRTLPVPQFLHRYIDLLEN